MTDERRFHLMSGYPPPEVRYVFHCPGCKCGHYVRTAGLNEPIWQFNGDLVSPTVSPSILIVTPDPDHPGKDLRRCHSYVRAGRIEFLSDCNHELAGRSVALPRWDGGQ